MTSGNRKERDDAPERVQELMDRRNDLGPSQRDVAKEMLSSDFFDVTERTVARYISRWETAQDEPTEQELDEYEAALDRIEAEQNRERPPCSDPNCQNTSPKFDVEYIDDDPYCLVCYYTREIEPVNENNSDSDSVSEVSE